MLQGIRLQELGEMLVWGLGRFDGFEANSEEPDRAHN